MRRFRDPLVCKEGGAAGSLICTFRRLWGAVPLHTYAHAGNRRDVKVKKTISSAGGRLVPLGAKVVGRPCTWA